MSVQPISFSFRIRSCHKHCPVLGLEENNASARPGSTFSYFFSLLKNSRLTVCPDLGALFQALVRLRTPCGLHRARAVSANNRVSKCYFLGAYARLITWNFRISSKVKVNQDS